MNEKAFSFRVWIGGLAVGIIFVGGFLGAIGVPAGLAGFIGFAAGIGIVILMILNPETIMNCPHCGSMLRHNAYLCPKCRKPVRADRSSTETTD
jgi:DNA-directed RNA polymerase subunit RPC12/RpoP